MQLPHRAREGDFLETPERFIFYVRGHVHPPDRVVCFVRYLPDPLGDRRRGITNFTKIPPFSDHDQIARDRFPQYIVYDPILDLHLVEVQVRKATRWYKPQQKLEELGSTGNLDRVERCAVDLAELIQKTSGVPWNKMGVTGSVLVGLHTDSSDVDLVIYGKKNCLLAHEALQGLAEDGRLKAYDREDLLHIYREWHKVLPFNNFMELERRKPFKGRFKGRRFYIRFVRDWGEVREKYGDVNLKSVGLAKITATIADDSESIYTPCRYPVNDVRILEGPNLQPLREVLSFLIEPLNSGEKIVAFGKLERVITRDAESYYRMVIGAEANHYLYPIRDQ